MAGAPLGRGASDAAGRGPIRPHAKVAKRVYDKLNDPNYQPPKARVARPELPSDAVDLTRLPETGAALFGRDLELQLLDSAWDSAGGGRYGRSPSTSSRRAEELLWNQRGDPLMLSLSKQWAGFFHELLTKPAPAPTRVVAFTANGGVGKSTLVNHWLRKMQRDNFRGATRVFGWSFYSQGAREEGMASADSFIDAALRFFGDADATAGSPWDKGERLARLVGAQRALLVLDGLEPLQSAHAFDRGTLRDPALHTLLRGLARRAGGLCVITTREPLPDLHGMAGVGTYDLERISPEAGRALLRTARVVGTDSELEDLSKRFGLHALTVSLLGVYLYEKDSLHGTGPAQALEQQPGTAPIDRVLGGFEALLADSAELEVLRLLGLFDRPADSGCLGALRAKPAITGLTERVMKPNDVAWNGALARLEKLRLVHVQRKRTDAATFAIDAHPLLREHFAAQLGGSQPDAWRAAHQRLYEHLCDTSEYQPDGLDGLQPLFQAVAHGCQAGLYQKVCDEVFFARIRRGNENYAVTKLGAFGTEAGAVACFFERLWGRVSLQLTEGDQAWLFAVAAFDLRALGRLSEALEPMRVGLPIAVERKDWKNAATNAGNLSELELTLGDVAAAVRNAGRSVTIADRSGDEFERIKQRVKYADALHQAGQRTKALARFDEAEKMEAEHQRRYPLLYSTAGFRYCDLLLAEAERAAWKVLLRFSSGARGEGRDEVDAEDSRRCADVCHAVSQRAAQTLKWDMQQCALLDIGMDHLTLGRSALPHHSEQFCAPHAAFRIAARPQ
ncbi:MAG: hypothetical protein ACHQ4J_02560 [Candidatus Binatia bacterium]